MIDISWTNHASEILRLNQSYLSWAVFQRDSGIDASHVYVMLLCEYLFLHAALNFFHRHLLC